MTVRLHNADGTITEVEPAVDSLTLDDIREWARQLGAERELDEHLARVRKWGGKSERAEVSSSYLILSDIERRRAAGDAKAELAKLKNVTLPALQKKAVTASEKLSVLHLLTEVLQIEADARLQETLRASAGKAALVEGK